MHTTLTIARPDLNEAERVALASHAADDLVVAALSRSLFEFVHPLGAGAVVVAPVLVAGGWDVVTGPIVDTWTDRDGTPWVQVDDHAGLTWVPAVNCTPTGQEV